MPGKKTARQLTELQKQNTLQIPRNNYNQIRSASIQIESEVNNNIRLADVEFSRLIKSLSVTGFLNGNESYGFKKQANPDMMRALLGEVGGNGDASEKAFEEYLDKNPDPKTGKKETIEDKYHEIENYYKLLLKNADLYLRRKAQIEDSVNNSLEQRRYRLAESISNYATAKLQNCALKLKMREDAAKVRAALEDLNTHPEKTAEALDTIIDIESQYPEESIMHKNIKDICEGFAALKNLPKELSEKHAAIGSFSKVNAAVTIEGPEAETEEESVPANEISEEEAKALKEQEKHSYYRNSQSILSGYAGRLENALIGSDSSEYESIISTVKNLNEEELGPWKNAGEMDPARNHAAKLLKMKQAVDKYIRHKAGSGVNKKDYYKLAAVEELNKYLISELKSLDLREFEEPELSELNDIIDHLDDEVPENQPDRSTVNANIEIAAGYDSRLNAQNCGAALDCMDRIIALAQGSRKNALLNMQKNFLDNPGQLTASAIRSLVSDAKKAFDKAEAESTISVELSDAIQLGTGTKLSPLYRSVVRYALDKKLSFTVNEANGEKTYRANKAIDKIRSSAKKVMADPEADYDNLKADGDTLLVALRDEVEKDLHQNLETLNSNIKNSADLIKNLPEVELTLKCYQAFTDPKLKIAKLYREVEFSGDEIKYVERLTKMRDRLSVFKDKALSIGKEEKKPEAAPAQPAQPAQPVQPADSEKYPPLDQSNRQEASDLMEEDLVFADEKTSVNVGNNSAAGLSQEIQQSYKVPDTYNASPDMDDQYYFDRDHDDLKKLMEDLEKAKTGYNSGDYNNIISSINEVNKDALKPWKKAEAMDPEQRHAARLLTIKYAINKYIEHKAADGVKRNTYHKLAAVEALNKFVTDKLSELNPETFKDYPLTKFNKLIRDIEKELKAAKNNTRKENDPQAKSAVQYAAISGKKTSAAEYNNVLDCMDRIIGSAQAAEKILREPASTVSSLNDLEEIEARLKKEGELNAKRAAEANKFKAMIPALEDMQQEFSLFPGDTKLSEIAAVSNSITDSLNKADRVEKAEGMKGIDRILGLTVFEDFPEEYINNKRTMLIYAIEHDVPVKIEANGKTMNSGSREWARWMLDTIKNASDMESISESEEREHYIRGCVVEIEKAVKGHVETHFNELASKIKTRDGLIKEWPDMNLTMKTYEAVNEDCDKRQFSSFRNGMRNLKKFADLTHEKFYKRDSRMNQREAEKNAEKKADVELFSIPDEPVIGGMSK